MTRVPVAKTYKLFIGGEFPRSESGRTYTADGHNVARASRKDARDAVRAARAAMLETRRASFAALTNGEDEVDTAIDRVVWYAGWADKLPQVLGGSNPVAGPYFNFTVPEPTGVVAVLTPSEPALGILSRVLPALVGGNTVVAVASHEHPLTAIELAEAFATSDLPGGAVNLLTGYRDELASWLAGHMDVNAIDLTGMDGDTSELERLAAENVKRGVCSTADVQSPWEIEAYLEHKTVWHPIGL